MADKKGVTLLVSIVERGVGKELTHFYSSCGLACHFQSVGRGTASSDLLDILGLGSSERDVVLSFGEKQRVRQVLWRFRETMEPPVRAKGIAFGLRLNALNTLAAAALLRESEEEEEEGVGQMDEQDWEEGHSLILIVVNQGHTDDVMNTARAAGARGGTIIRSRWAGGEGTETFYGISLQAEKEVILIVAGSEQRKLIMESVNKKHGMNTAAGGMICSVPIDQMQRLG